MATGRIIKERNAYTYIISAGRDPVSGKYKQIWRRGFKTKREADQAMRMHLQELDSGHAPTGLTVGEFLDLFIQNHCTGMKPSAFKTYEYTCGHYIDPVLGKVRLDRLSHTDISRLYESWSDLAPSTVHRIHRVLRTALNYAVKQGYLMRSPMTRVDSPERRVQKRNTLSVQQAKSMLEWLKTRRYTTYMACFLAMYTGMRAGEVAGLQWHDVEWASNVLHVRRARQRTNGEDIVGLPKTEDSERDIVVPVSVLSEMRLWYDSQQVFSRQIGLKWDESSYVVRLPDLEVPDPHIFARGVKVALTQLGYPLVTFHDLRHTHATWLLESGVDLKVVSQRLGHSTIAVTADVYSHVTRRLQEDAVRKLENMMDKEHSREEDL